jgi:hypothetical protein
LQEIEVMMKKLWPVVVLGLSSLLLDVASAHGDAKAKHGGVVAMSSDLGFELVGTPAGAVIYVEDHGKPMDPTGLKGKLTVLNGAEKSEADLVVAGDRLEAKGLKLAKGAKVVAALVTPAAKAITVRFTVR